MDSIEKHCEMAYRSAKLVQHPFPYFVIDDFLPAETFAQLVKSGFSAQAQLKRQFETSLEAGKTVHSNEGMNATANIPIKLLGGEFGSKLIGDLFGINDVSSMFDRPNFGGYYPFHQMSSGGLLGSHVDHSFSTDQEVHVGNCIFYAHSRWQDDWGGETVLFDSFGFKDVARVVPKPNRLLVFMHSSHSFHGVDVVKCPPLEKRMTYYMDYYASKENARLAYDKYQVPPNSSALKSWVHGTTFVPFRPLGNFKNLNILILKQFKTEAIYVLVYCKYLFGCLLAKIGFAR